MTYTQVPTTQMLPATTQAASEDGASVSFHDFLQVLQARRHVIVATVVSILAIAIITLFQMSPRYTAKALVMIDPQTDQVVDFQQILASLNNDATTVRNQIEIIRSRSLAERVIRDLGLRRDPELQPATDSPPWYQAYLPGFLGGTSPSEPRAQPDERDVMDGIINRFLKNLEVLPQALNSSAIRIEYTSGDPRHAARLTNAVAEFYVQDQLEAKFEANRKATLWLTERLDALSSQVQDAERRVERYKIENSLTQVQGGESLVNQRLVDLNAQLSLARAETAQFQAKLDQANSLFRAGQSFDSITQVVGSPLISELRTQESLLLRREAELANRYGARHPRIIELRAERSNLEAKIQEEVRRIIQQLRNDLQVKRAQEQAYLTQLQEIEGQAAEENQVRIRLRELERAAESSRQLYELLLKRFQETRGQEEIQVPDARILSAAIVPGSPSAPKKGLILALVAPSAIMLGIVLAFLLEQLDNGFKTARQVEEKLGLPNLATIPELSGRLKRTGINVIDYAVDKPLSHYAESVRGFLASLKLSDVDNPPKIVLITSAVPSEGKTTFAATAARIAATQGRRVVLVDADLRRPSVVHNLGFDRADTGIVEYLGDDQPLENSLRRDDLTNLDILPVAMRPINPADLLASRRMADLLKELRNRYDLVIIDSAPILPVHDTKHLIPYADKVVFIIRWEQTPRDAVSNAVKEVRGLHAPIAGTVMTRVNMRRNAIYSHGYYRYKDYNKYYTS